MRRYFLIVPLVIPFVLAACSDEPVGQSAYFDPWENPQIPRASQPTQSAEVLELNRQVEMARLRNAADVAAQSGDAALVASLEAAIASAGAPSAGPVPPQSGTVAATSGPAATLPASDPNAIAGSTRISDNSFSTVVERETIETDAARLAAQSQSSVVLQAKPLPSRQSGVNLAAFAISTTHNIGERVYKRSSRKSASRRCREYGNPDEAQRAFLAAGGPVSDELRLDPDGDGFVCGWSPMPFRNLNIAR